MQYFNDEEVVQALPMSEAIRLVDQSFRWLTMGEAVNAPRQRSSAFGTELNVMWALVPPVGLIGVKSYPVVRSDVTQGAEVTLLLNDISSGAMRGAMRADRLGQIRTGAASAVSIRALAREDSSVLTVFGAGFQAESQLRAAAQVLPRLRSIRVVGRDPVRRDEFVQRMTEELSMEIQGGDAEASVNAADVIITATGSQEPLFDGQWVKPGTHICAVGSNSPLKREIDGVVLDRAAHLVVDDRDVASVECGDLLRNDFNPGEWPSLGEVLTGQHPIPRQPEAITIFESHGLAVQDVVCASHVLVSASQAESRYHDFLAKPTQE